MANVFIASPIRNCTGGASTVKVDAESLRDAMDHLVRDYPRLRQQLYDETGALRSFVNLFVNGSAIHDSDGFANRLGEGDTVEILLAVCGGSCGTPSAGRAR